MTNTTPSLDDELRNILAMPLVRTKDDNGEDLYFKEDGQIRRDEQVAALTALIEQQVMAARVSELEMFKHIEVMDMSKSVTAHITRRIATLKAEGAK